MTPTNDDNVDAKSGHLLDVVVQKQIFRIQKGFQAFLWFSYIAIVIVYGKNDNKLKKKKKNSGLFSSVLMSEVEVFTVTIHSWYHKH